MDAEFLRYKLLVERELGRPVDYQEEHELKLFYYFGKGLKLKKQLDSEPERIGPIAERAVKDIERRAEQRRSGILSAIADFMRAKKTAAKRRRQTWPRQKSASKQNQGTGKLS